MAEIEGLEPSRSRNEPVAGPSSGGTFANLPPLTLEDCSKFMRIFAGSGPSDGILDGTSFICSAVYGHSHEIVQVLALVKF